jgi:hypothetical protein
VLTPKGDGSGYALRTALRMNPAALVAQGGREVRYSGSCGGPIWSKADLLTFAPTLRFGRGI